MPSKIPIEQEYAFVLSCLRSALDNGGKIDFNLVASQHKLTAHGAQQRIRRCQKSGGFVAAGPDKSADNEDPEGAAIPVNAAKRKFLTFLSLDALIAFVLFPFVTRIPVTDSGTTGQVAKHGLHAVEKKENGGSKKRKLNELIGRAEDMSANDPIKGEAAEEVQGSGV